MTSEQLDTRFSAGDQLTPSAVVWLAIGMATVGGVGEALYRSVRQWATHRPAALYYWELVWMAPLSAAVAGTVVGIALALAARLSGVRVPARAAWMLFGFTAVYPVIQSEGIPLHWVADILVSLGLTAFAFDGIELRRTSLGAWIRLLRPYLVGLLASLGVVGVLGGVLSSDRLSLVDRVQVRANMPNVLLIILDTVRASELGLYGYERSTDPWLRQWAHSSVVFDRAYATAPWTLPSHASFFTGHYAFELSTGFSKPLDDTYPTLAETLADNGYATAGFVANTTYASRMSGLQRGFDRYEAIPIDATQFARSSWLSLGLVRHIPFLERLFRLAPRGAEEIMSSFLAWQSNQDERPFFVFLNLIDAHAPYEPPEAYRTLFGPPPTSGWDYVFNTWGLYEDTAYTSERLEAWRGRYDGSIRYIDDQLSAMFAALDARGILENTLVVIASDHGEMWGEKGQVDHATSLYHPLLHVPLVIRIPGPRSSGRRVPAPVSLRDLPATILDLIGVSDSPIPGNSFRALVVDSTAVPQPSGPIRSDLGLYPEEVAGWAPGVANWAPAVRGPMSSLIVDSLHYIRNGDGVEELYDVWRDPFESVDLSGLPDAAPSLESMRSALDTSR